MFDRQEWMHRAGDYPTDRAEQFGLFARALFSAGLGPHVLAGRWKAMTAAFHGWDVARVATMDERDVSRMLGDPEVIRNRRKIEATIENARRIEAAGPDTLAGFVAAAAAGDVWEIAEALSQTFACLGPTTAYFFLFACGVRPSAWESAA